MDIEQFIKSPKKIRDLNLNYSETSTLIREVSSIKCDIEFIRKKYISSILLSIFSVILIFLFFYIVINTGNLFDFILSGAIINSFFVMIYLEIKDVKSLKLELIKNKYSFFLKLETEEERISRIRLQKFQEILS